MAPSDSPARMGSDSPHRTATEILQALASDAKAGLASVDAQRRLDRDGENAVPKKQSHALLRFAKKFWGVSAWMIELIAVLSFFLHKRADLAIAVSLLVVNAVLSFVQEQRALKAVTALSHQLQVTARVLRDGLWKAMSARALVAGDVVRIRAGDFVPADLQLLDGAVQIDQSALTGESNEVSKKVDDAIYSGSTVRHWLPISMRPACCLTIPKAAERPRPAPVPIGDDGDDDLGGFWSGCLSDGIVWDVAGSHLHGPEWESW